PRGVPWGPPGSASRKRRRGGPGDGSGERSGGSGRTSRPRSTGRWPRASDRRRRPCAARTSCRMLSLAGRRGEAPDPSPTRPLARHVLEPVLGHERQVVALIEDLAVDPRIELAQAADLAVLLGHEPLVERRDLDVEVVHRQIEVPREALDHVAVSVPFEVERRRLVVPLDLVEVQQLGELALAGVSEGNRVARERRGLGRRALGHAPPAARALPPFFPAFLARVPSSSVHTLSTAIAKTPCPLASRSTTASGDSTWAV